MNAEEPTRDMITAALVERLIAEQFPRWAGLSVRPVDHGGWDNLTFHLGDELSVRLPSGPGYVDQVEKEHRWLPVLAPLLPLPIPVPAGRGVPSATFPRPWSVYRWLPGRIADRARIGTGLETFAADVADFLVALRKAPADDGPTPAQHNWSRGAHPYVYADQVERCLPALPDRRLADRLAAVWADAGASRWDRPPVWFHGDIAFGNLLTDDGGRLSAVIDFGTSGVGDPACDLALTWTFLTGTAREVYRERLELDEGTWVRGRAWTLWKALLSFDPQRSPGPRDDELRQLIEIADEHERMVG